MTDVTIISLGQLAEAVRREAKSREISISYFVREACREKIARDEPMVENGKPAAAVAPAASGPGDTGNTASIGSPSLPISFSPDCSTNWVIVERHEEMMRR